MDPLLVTAATALAAWLYLALGHGRFWQGDCELESAEAPPGPWPAVTAIVPARDEEACIVRSVSSLLEQDYPGDFRIVVVDDQSSDATSKLARELAAQHRRGERLHVLSTPPRPPGWVGKMWAVETGVRHALATRGEQGSPAWLLLSDADVEHSPANLHRLVSKGRADRLDLVSLMVRLHCASLWERLLVPAFVYFFQKLYPFPRINDPRSRVAGAAGGCMLVRREALERVGGIPRIRGEVIDDCALGKALKENGPIWVGLTSSETSFRPYEGLRDLWDMVARSAYTQLKHSPVLLVGTVLGLGLLYGAPPGLALSLPLHGDVSTAALAGAAWLVASATYRPTLRRYGLSAARAPLLPVAGALYLAMTLDSARRHALGRGARWKGRDRAGDGAA